MSFDEAKDLILTSSLTLIIGYLSYQVKTLVSSVTELNIKMATILTHLENHKERLERHECHLQRLEDRFDNT